MIAVKGSSKYQKIIRGYFQGFRNVWCCNCDFFYYIVINGIVHALPEHKLPEGTIIITHKELREL